MTGDANGFSPQGASPPENTQPPLFMKVMDRIEPKGYFTVEKEIIALEKYFGTTEARNLHQNLRFKQRGSRSSRSKGWEECSEQADRWRSARTGSVWLVTHRKTESRSAVD